MTTVGIERELAGWEDWPWLPCTISGWQTHATRNQARSMCYTPAGIRQTAADARALIQRSKERVRMSTRVVTELDRQMKASNFLRSRIVKATSHVTA
jgi:hypothetical protein